MSAVRIRIIPVLAAGLLLCAAGLFWPNSTKRRQFTVAVNIWPGAEGLLSAREAPAFKDVPATFMEFSWSAAVLGAFQKRVADAAVVSLDELLRLEAGDAQPQAVLVLGVSRGSDAIFARPGIGSVSALQGKKVGVELHSAGEYLLYSVLQKHGLTPADVEIVPLNLAETESAFVEQDLDAVVTADPWRARLADRGATLLADSSGMGLEMCRVLVVRRDSARQFHDEILRLVRVCLEHAEHRGSSWEEGGVAAMLRREDLTSAQWRLALAAIQTPGAGENVRLLESVGGEDGKGGLAEVLGQMAAKMQAAGWLDPAKTIDPALLLNAELVKEVR